MLTKEELVEQASNINMGDLYKGKILTECLDCEAEVVYNVKHENEVECVCTECSTSEVVDNVRIVL